MAALQRAPVRQSEIIYPTPLIADVLFSELVDTTRRAVPAYGTAHLDAVKWPHHKLVFAREAAAGDSGRDGTFEFFYAADRDSQDNYNFSFTQADIGGTRFDAVARTYVTLRSAFTPDTPAMGAVMPDVPESLFAGTYVLAEKRQQRIGEQELDSLYVAEAHVYVKRCTITQLGIDSLNGKMQTSTSTLYYASEVVTGSTTAAELFADPANAYWGLQDDGTQRTGRQLSCAWFEIVTETVVAGTVTAGVVGVTTYTTNDNFYWPPVLESYNIMVWPKRDGSEDLAPALRFHPEGYNGPCKNEITITWSRTPFTIPLVEIMQPTRIYYACPFYTVNIPECLHEEAYFQGNTTNLDEIYEWVTGSDRYYAATNYTTWPESIVAYDDQEPYRGGYLRTRRVIYSPPIPDNVNFETGAPI